MSRIDDIATLLNNPDLDSKRRQELESERYHLVAHHTIPMHDREQAAADYMSTRDSFAMRRIEQAIKRTKEEIEAYESLNSNSQNVKSRLSGFEYTLKELETQRDTLLEKYKRLPLDSPKVPAAAPAPEPPTVSEQPVVDLAFEALVENIFNGDPTPIDPMGLLKGQDKNQIRFLLANAKIIGEPEPQLTGSSGTGVIAHDAGVSAEQVEGMTLDYKAIADTIVVATAGAIAQEPFLKPVEQKTPDAADLPSEQ
jgi:hypothetical protein